jgi:hypothetical protein
MAILSHVVGTYLDMASTRLFARSTGDPPAVETSTAVVTDGQGAGAVAFESGTCVPGIGDVFASQTIAEDAPSRASR